MDRREFLRRLLITGIMGAAGVGGIVAIVEKLTPPSSQPTISLLPTGSESSGSLGPTTILETTTVTETVTAAPNSTADPSTTSGSNTKSASSSTTQPSSSRSTTTSTSNSLSGYIYLAPLSAVNGKTYAYFNHPNYGSSILINYGGTWRAFSAVCTHAGCTVNYTSASLNCPCHNGNFSPVNGAPTSGPVSVALAEYDIKVASNNLYVSSVRIN